MSVHLHIGVGPTWLISPVVGLTVSGIVVVPLEGRLGSVSRNRGRQLWFGFAAAWVAAMLISGVVGPDGGFGLVVYWIFLAIVAVEGVIAATYVIAGSFSSDWVDTVGLFAVLAGSAIVLCDLVSATGGRAHM